MDDIKGPSGEKKRDDTDAPANGSNADGKDGPAADIPVNFSFFISGLMMEALVALGEIEHPITKKKDVNTQHAKMMIDTLDMIKEKTKNNLSKEESGMLDAILYEARMRFLSKNGK